MAGKKRGADEEWEEERPVHLGKRGTQSAVFTEDATLKRCPDMTALWETPAVQRWFTNVDFVTDCGTQLSVGFCDGSGETYTSINRPEGIQFPRQPETIGFILAEPFHIQIWPCPDGQLLEWECGRLQVPLEARFSQTDGFLFAWCVQNRCLCCWSVQLATNVAQLNWSEPLPQNPVTLVPAGDRCMVLMFNHTPLKIDRYGAAETQRQQPYVGPGGFIFTDNSILLCQTPFPGPGPQWVRGSVGYQWSVITDNGMVANLCAANCIAHT